MNGSRVGFRPLEPMSAVEADTYVSWFFLSITCGPFRALNVLITAINQIHLQNASSLSFEELYRTSYKLVLHKYGAKLYTAIHEVIRAHLATVATKLSQTVTNRLFMTQLICAWNDHKLVMGMIRDILMYMDKNYVRQSNKPCIWDLGLRTFQTEIVMNAGNTRRFLDGVFQLIDDCRRNPSTVDYSMVPKLLSILTESSQGRDCEDLFECLFLEEFLTSTYRFYHEETTKRLIDLPNFAGWGLEAFQAENRRVREDFQSVKPLPMVLEVLSKAVIFPSYNTVIGSLFVDFLRSKKTAELAQMFKLYSATPTSAKCLKDAFAVELSDRLRREKSSLTAIMEIRENFSSLLRQCFGSSSEYHQCLKSVFEEILNLDEDGGAGSVTRRLVVFLDQVLRKARPGWDVEVRAAVEIFRFIHSKDIFEALYKVFLARRILGASSLKAFDTEGEMDVIRLLKLDCGAAYTGKLEGMISDHLKSQELAGDFSNTLVNVWVLTAGVWPSMHCENRVVVPREISVGIEEFEKFYTKKFAGRKLTWVSTEGSAEVKAAYANKTWYVLSLSIVQALILNLFNEKSSLTTLEIEQGTGLRFSELERHLLALSQNPKCPILLQTDSSVLTVNEAFQSKSRQVRVPQVINKTLAPAILDLDTAMEAGVPQAVEDDRKHLIEATLVRIMKSRRQLDHNSLSVEVTNILNPRFLPSVAMINGRIDNLVEREFIAKDNDDLKMYYYVA